MRSRAAPIGISVTVSAGSLDGVGLSASGVMIASRSACQAGIFCAPVVILIGAFAGLKGSFADPSPVVTAKPFRARPYFHADPGRTSLVGQAAVPPTLAQFSVIASENVRAPKSTDTALWLAVQV